MKFVSYRSNSLRYVAPAYFQESDTPATAISKLLDFETPPPNSDYQYSKPLQQYLYGRKLLLQEIPIPLETIHEHYQNGYVTYHKGIIEKNGSYFCERCGNENRIFFASHHCARCEEECVYCRQCIMMGKVSQCSPLLTWSGPAIHYEKRKDSLTWQGVLSPGQRQASERIVASVGQARKILVWAVCGSGKTEVLFSGLNKAIEEGQTVLIATPRTDVVHELTPRLRAVLPRIQILSLFGGSEDRGKEGQIVIATTHQLLRFEQHFDFVVIDEVDAFPFSIDPMLKYAVQKAAKQGATTIFLTATPDKKLQKLPNLEIIKIPNRYHGFPLPIPRIQWSGNWRKLLKKGRVPKVIIAWLEKKLEVYQQVFLFVPSVTVLNQLVPILRRHITLLEGVHAEDPFRREKVQKFRNSDIRILVTTTILERGVTVPNVAVAVFGADDDVFTESALVQISGRVGRSAQFPTGEIVFFHYGKTEAMLDAIDHIKLMNKLGGF